MSAYRKVIKHWLDAVAAAALLVLLSPILFAVAAVIYLLMGRPVLFTQLRPALGERPFRVFKFRTMTNATNDEGQVRPDAERLTRLGCFLRTTSLDELPELVNVLRGEMSLVGPRPLLMQYLGRYTPTQARRHEVRPGITGWAQVNGRNALTWEERFKLDVWYVDHVSFWLDVRILARTVVQVFKREGISAVGHATMPEFLGTAVDDSAESGRETTSTRPPNAGVPD